MQLTEIQSEIKRLYLLGCENKSIAIITGLTVNQVNRVIYKDLELQSKNKKLSMNEIKEAADLYKAGLKRREIQSRLGISRHRVNQILRKAV